MIAFTFPGQGSQRPELGTAWVDHPSWELELGERPHLAERLLVTPVAGVFHRSPVVGDGGQVAAGDEVGSVSGHPVRSAFSGRLMSFLAIEGERVTPRQPVAWLLDGSVS